MAETLITAFFEDLKAELCAAPVPGGEDATIAFSSTAAALRIARYALLRDGRNPGPP
jgi:hypothetical protein